MNQAGKHLVWGRCNEGGECFALMIARSLEGPNEGHLSTGGTKLRGLRKERRLTKCGQEILRYTILGEKAIQLIINEVKNRNVEGRCPALAWVNQGVP